MSALIQGLEDLYQPTSPQDRLEHRDLSSLFPVQDDREEYRDQSRGYDGLRHLAGVPQADANPYFAPVLVRGMYGLDLGQYYAWYQGDVTSHQALRAAVDALLTASWGWSVETPHEALGEAVEYRLKEMIDPESKAFADHLETACMYRVFGFLPFLIHRGEEEGLKLSLRWPSTVQEWLLSPETGELWGVKFTDIDDPVPASDLMIYSREAYGTAYEGVSIYRQVGLLIKAKQDLLRIQAQAATIHGVGQVVISETAQGVSNNEQDTRLLNMMASAVGTDRPVYKIRYGHDLKILSPQGQVPDFDRMIRYLDEQITSVVQAQGSLIGLNSHGSYALADSKAQDALAQAQTVGRVISTTLVDMVKRILVEEGWPMEQISIRLSYVWPQASKDVSVDDLIKLVDKGFVDSQDPRVQALALSLLGIQG